MSEEAQDDLDMQMQAMAHELDALKAAVEWLDRSGQVSSLIKHIQDWGSEDKQEEEHVRLLFRIIEGGRP